jgi:hypothetical protein
MRVKGQRTTKTEVPRGNTQNDLKLVPNLVPTPLWHISAYHILRKAEWDTIRRDSLTAADNQCSICRSGGPGLICHEKWEYDERQAIATLTGFVIVCRACNNVIHFGRAKVVGYANDARQHMCRVNGISETDANKAIHAAWDAWQRRSEILEWTVRVDAVLLERYPALTKLQS